MKIESVAPVAAAASPKHADHSRWVKEKTLQLEAAHIQIAGGTFRDAETAGLGRDDAGRYAVFQTEGRTDRDYPFTGANFI